MKTTQFYSLATLALPLILGLSSSCSHSPDSRALRSPQSTAQTEALENPIDQLVRSLEETEQVCFEYSVQTNVMRMQSYLREYDSAMRPWLGTLAQYQIKTSAAPAEWLNLVSNLPLKKVSPEIFQWNETKLWNRQLLLLPSEKRCEAFKLAYSLAIWKLSTTPPETALTGPWDIQVNEQTDPPAILSSVARDRARAAWYLRYAHYTNIESLPNECTHFKIEAEKRWNYVFTERRPLGLAIGMCGRPMNAHYIDDEVIDKTRPTPPGWMVK